MRTEPDRAGITQSLVREAVTIDLRTRKTHPSDCLAKLDLIGEHRLRFRTDVSASGDVVTTSRWKLDQILDGTELPQAAIRCMEDMLGGPRTIAAPDGVVFVNYTGPIYDDFAAAVAPKTHD